MGFRLSTGSVLLSHLYSLHGNHHTFVRSRACDLSQIRVIHITDAYKQRGYAEN